jgi:hypothetical protein
LDLEGKIEHARVGGPVDQGAGRVAGSGLAQRPQQLGDAPRVAEAGLGGGSPGQGAGRVAVAHCEHGRNRKLLYGSDNFVSIAPGGLVSRALLRRRCRG